MGVVLPGWADEVLDLIGVSWPNVDEDDYREMATAMREFAGDINDGASQAHDAIQALVSSAGGGQAAEALNAHWSKINGTHLTKLAQCGELAATALDGVAVLIEGAKIGAIVQLGILAAEVIAAQAAAPFTLGLSEVGALGATQVTRVIVKRLFKEVCQQVAEQVVSIALTPVEEALGAMVGDLVVQLGANALGVKDGVDLGQTAKAGKEGFAQGVQGAKDAAKSAADNPMQLLSASGSGGGGGVGGGSGSGPGAGGFTFDHDAHNKAVTGLHSAGGHFRNTAGGKIGRAKSHHGRTRGKDAIADAANTMLDKVIDGIEDAVKKSAKHLDDNMTRGIKQMAKNHHENDKGLADHFKGIGKDSNKDPKSPGRGKAGNSTNRRSGPSRKSAAAESADADHPRDKTRRDEGRCTDGTDPVDLATGKVFLSQTDITLPGVLPLIFTRRYESSIRIGKHVGPSWTSTIDQRLEIDSAEVIFVTEAGLLLRYGVPDIGTSILPKNGPRWPLERTPQGDWAVYDPTARTTRYFSEPLDHPGIALLDEIIDQNGHRILFDYAHGASTPHAIRHSSGYKILLAYDERNLLAALYLANAADDGSDALIRTYTHDEFGNLVSITNSVEAVTRFEYDTEHRMTSWVDSNGSRYEYAYDERHRCTSQAGRHGHISNRFTYGEADPETRHRTTIRTDGKGASTQYLINDRLQVVAVTDPLGNTTRSTYDAHDRPLYVTDPLGAVTQWVYDEAGRPVRLIHPDGSSNSVVYNGLGLPTEITGPDGKTYRQEYDTRGNRISVADPAGQITRFTHDQRGFLTSVTDPLGAVSRIKCNAAGLPVALTDPLGASTVIHRDAFGRAISVTDPTGHTVHHKWNTEGNISTRSISDSSVETWTYDGEGNCTSYTDPMGHTTKFEYGHFDQLSARIDPDGARYEFTHDTELRLREVTNPQGLTWQYEYDAAGRLISETDFDGRTQSYTHDAAGRLASRTTPLGYSIKFQYDVLGRVQVKDADGEITTFRYDAAGRPVRINSQNSQVAYLRDDCGQVVEETVDGRVTTYEYDAVGRCISRTTPTGAVSRWTYDPAGRRTGLDASGRHLTFSRDALGRELARALGDVVHSHTFDTLGRLTEQHITSAAETIQRRTYDYRSDGSLIGVDDFLHGPRRFDIDAAGRVAAVSAREWSETYAYDLAGNQVAATWPDRNPAPEARGERIYTGTRLNRAGRVHYEHDAAGRTTLRRITRLSRKPDVWRYTWDAEDRLVACSTPNGTIWHYTYDPMGRRTAKSRLAEDGRSIAEQVTFTWDGATLCEQTTHVSGETRQVVITWDHEGLRPLIQRERRTVTHSPQQEIDQRFFTIVSDLVGTPTELIDESGHVAYHTRTAVWGRTAWNAGATAYIPLRFPGQYFDPETQLHYNYFRHYDPDVGRYLTVDPLGLEPADNPVAYVGNPLTWSDPYGLSPYKPATNVGTIDPALVRFSQSSVSNHFGNGHTVEQTAAGLRSGWINPEDVPPVRLTVRNGNLYTLDNRRLVAFQKAGVPIPFRMASREEAMAEEWKFTNKKDGLSIVVNKLDPEEWSP
ncbi:DUF6531 domain-containing protein [Streptomyces rimosus]|uniref:DUF6531 domain-containing protein n=1 Tax=Streptomyces rimosus TaxID=1927 RepID=UPI00067DEC5D|nr:DUF6531 domain-containing protein [Streptomyces rimosus]